MEAKIEDLIGRTIKEIDVQEDLILFHCKDGAVFKMYHQQSCCESVTIDDICGDINDLIDSVVLKAEEICNAEPESQHEIDATNSAKEDYNTCTWTFYKFATRKGYVDIKWFGESNGYYSESVDFERIDNNNNLN